MSTETTYEWVQRRRKEGASVDTLASELAAQGVGAVEIDRVLDRGAVPGSARPSGPRARPTMASPQILLGAFLLAGGLLLLLSGQLKRAITLLFLGLVRTTTAWGIPRPSQARQDEARRQMLELGDDSQPRCAAHPTRSAMGTCPRCGSYCCARCAPSRSFADGYVCMACEALPEIESQRRRGASRGAALTLISAPATIVLSMAIEQVIADTSHSPLGVIVVLVVSCAPWLGLAVLQAHVLRGWPMVLSLILWVTVQAMFVISGNDLHAGLWLIPLAAILDGLESIRQAARGEPPFLSGPLNPTAP